MNAIQSRAYRVFMTKVFVSSLAMAVAFTINMVYLVVELGLDPLAMVLVGTALELSAFVFEIPTGVVADTTSRRLSVVLGTLLLGISFIVFGLTQSFAVILVSQVIAGLGFTFMSGAEAAWLSDEIGEDRANQAFLRAAQVGAVGGTIGIIGSVLLAMHDLSLPIVIGGIIMLVLAIYLRLAMSETGFKPNPRDRAQGQLRQTVSDMRQTVKNATQAIRLRPIILTILLLAVIHGAWTESFDRLWTLHLLENFHLPALAGLDNVVWFGVIGVAHLQIGIIVAGIARRRVDTRDVGQIVRALTWVNIGLIVLAVAFALAGDIWLALATQLGVGAMRTIHGPLQTAWINRGIAPSVRATVLSTMAQADALGQIGGGPMVGLSGRVFGVRVALVLGATLLLPAAWIYRMAHRNGHTQAPNPATLQ